MITTIVLIVCLSIIALIAGKMAVAVIRRQTLFGRPPVPVFYFVLAKLCVVVNLAFLLLKGLNIPVKVLFGTAGALEFIALALLVLGAVILFLSVFTLKKDLIFGLSSSTQHQLHTKGIYSLSRHPFYLGFIFILFSSCLLSPHALNILAFCGAWIIHHFIMIKEEQFLTEQYGDEYRSYAKRVKRYISL
jgi:protein-S-isoprenylcysteine O-methyltransferase Ste14